MTSAVASIGLTYRGTDVQQSNLGIFLELRQGFNETPAVRGADVIVPGKVGRILGTRMRDTRRVILEGIVQGAAGTEATSFRTLANTVIALFDPTISGNLVATMEDGSTKTLACRTLNSIWDQVGSPYFARVSIELESVTPDWT